MENRGSRKGFKKKELSITMKDKDPLCFMQTIRNLHDVGAFLFFVFGFYFILLVLLFRNDWYSSQALLLMRLSDIPFASVALIYGGTGLYLQLEPKDDEMTSPWGVIILAGCLILFASVLFLNFAFPTL